MSSSTPVVPFGEAVALWWRLGWISFGGPAGQVAVMHRLVVAERRWVDEGRFLHALSYCHLLPGPEAQQLATYLGWWLHGVRGGVAAGVLFVLPGFLVMLVLASSYALWGQQPGLSAVFFGLKAAVVAVVVEALVRLARRALPDRPRWLIAGAAFLALFVFAVPFPWVVGAAALLGAWAGAPAATAAGGEAPALPRGLGWRTLRTAVIWLLLWLAPLGLLALRADHGGVYGDLAAFFSHTAAVSFGGAYAVLAYVADRAVNDFAWLRAGEMVDGLALAETTPGPLILVLQFVGFLAAYRQPGELAPLAAGLLGAVVTVWCTFVPSFLWIFTGAPFLERLRAARGLNAALSGISAAAVGVIAFLAVWFALHVSFGRVNALEGPLGRLLVPDPRSFEGAAVAIAILAGLMIFRWKWPLWVTLSVAAALGLLCRGPFFG